MKTYELVMIGLIGPTLFIGLSVALYSALPAAVLDFASRHGRYIGLGKPERPDDSNEGSARITAVAGLQGQSA